MGEEVGAAIVTLDVAVQVAELVVELVDCLDEREDAVEGFELFDGVLVGLGFKAVGEFGWWGEG